MEDYAHVAFSYFNADIDAIESAALKIFSQKILAEKFQINRGALDLKVVQFGNPIPGGRGGQVALAFAPGTAPMHGLFVAKSADGWQTLVNRLNSELKTSCVSISTTNENDNFPMHSIKIYEGGEVVRLVRAMLDGDRWDFFEKGVIQPFENISHYKKRRVRDRLDRKILLEYLKQIGIDIEAPLFWKAKGDALYINESRPAPGQ